MILTGREIQKEIESGNITITPFNFDDVETNSYDFHLDNELRVYKDDILDSKKKNKTEQLIIPEDGLLLSPDKIYLARTKEVIGSSMYMPIIRGRSSTGRLGIFINITCDLVDVGQIKQIPLQLHVVTPVKIYPNMKVGQVTFWCIKD